MKSIKNIALTAFLGLATLSTLTLTSCNKEDEPKECELGITGADCDQAVIDTYVGTYKGNGTSSSGQTFTGWYVKIEKSGNNNTRFRLTLLEPSSSPYVGLNADLVTNTTYSIEKETIDGLEYTGTGSFGSNTLTLTLREEGDDIIILTFTNILKEN